MVKASETTPLLGAAREQANAAESEKPAHLPKLQILVLCGLRMTGPLMFYSLFAYVNDMLIENGIATPRSLGFYSGMLEACFCLTQAFATPCWGLLSDRFGRRPVLVYPGYFAAACLAAFGCSRTLAGLLVFRMAMGLGNGVEAIVKTSLVESTVESNQATAFVWAGMAWQVASTVSPVIGGQLAKPARWHLLDLPFLRAYPYALPALVSAGICVVICLMGQLFLKETKPKEVVKHKRHSLRDIMSRKLAIALAAWTSLMLIVATRMCIFVLFCATPIEHHGLGLSPPQIGLVLALNSIALVVFSPMVGPRMIRRWGKLRMLQKLLPTYVFFFAAMPIVQWATVKWGTGAMIVGLLFLLACNLVGHLCILASDLIISNACPDRSQLGAFNSLQQMGGSIGTLLSNWLMGSCFAIFGGRWPAYAVFVSAVLGTQVLCGQLEEGGGWREREQQEAAVE